MAQQQQKFPKVIALEPGEVLIVISPPHMPFKVYVSDKHNDLVVESLEPIDVPPGEPVRLQDLNATGAEEYFPATRIDNETIAQTFCPLADVIGGNGEFVRTDNGMEIVEPE